jgi:glycosyltransferase involved in cell wall biosynthesis
MSNVLHIVLNNYKNDNRVRRAAEVGLNLGFNVSVFALSDDRKTSITDESGVIVTRVFLKTRHFSKLKIIQLLKFVELLFKMIYIGKKKNPKIVHAHDLDGLLIGFFVAKLTNSKLIYDSHEYWSDSGIFGKNKIMLYVISFVENFLIKKSDLVITVSDNIAHLIKEKYKVNLPFVVRNLPEKWKSGLDLRLRNELRISNSTILILYQGVINGEGVVDLAKAFSKISDGDVALVFLGNGEGVQYLKENFNDNRIYFHPSVIHSDLPNFTCDADIGVHSMVGTNLNRINALPNKLFEYIQGGLALVISDLPEMSKVVNNYKVGLTFKNGDVEDLFNSLLKLIRDKKLMNDFKLASIRCSNELNWDVEKNKLINIYDKMIYGIKQ